VSGTPRVAGVVLLLALAAWLTYEVRRGETSRETARQRLQVAVGDQAPDFLLEDLERERVSLADYRGQVVLLDFWATWCRPCRVMMPVLDWFYKKHRDSGVVILSVNEREGRERVRDAPEGRKQGFRVLLDCDGRVGDAYGVSALPVLVMVDREGKVAWAEVGYKPDLQKQLVRQLKALGRPSSERKDRSDVGDLD